MNLGGILTGIFFTTDPGLCYGNLLGLAVLAAVLVLGCGAFAVSLSTSLLLDYILIYNYCPEILL